MAYIQRYQRLSPDLQTEWGTYTNSNIVFNPDAYKFRQPAVPLLAHGQSDVIHPQSMSGGMGYIGDYVQSPMGNTGLLGNDTLKTVLILAGIALVLYFLLKDKEPQKNPCLVATGEPLDYGQPRVAQEDRAPVSSRRHTRAGKKRLSRIASVRPRDSKGRFI